MPESTALLHTPLSQVAKSDVPQEWGLVSPRKISDLRVKVPGVLDHHAMTADFTRDALLGLGTRHEHRDAPFAADLTFADAFDSIDFVKPRLRLF